MAVSLALFSGCTATRIIREPSGAAREAGVPEMPPEPKVEVAGDAPGPDFVWVSGFWSWPGRWEWVAGHWDKQPSPQATYVSGHWIQHNDYWAWVPGYWKEAKFALPR